jgi:serine phosphatase RsbU (regulator of sigma subunit)
MPVRGENRKFKYRDRNFTFEYTGIWFTNPEALRYRYMLKGYEDKWNYSNRSQARYYPKLPPGDYTFTAEVSLDGKNWFSSPESLFSFRIKPPFWRTWWFISVLTVSVISGIYLYIRIRVRKLEKDKAVLENEVVKRTEEIRKQNDELARQKKEIEEQRDIAEEQRDMIEAQNDEIQSSIRYAQKIQAATLPPKKLLEKTLKEYFILNKPKDIVSGDFYWVAQNSTHIFFAVGDCTGHGVPGSFMSMLGLSALNDIVKSLRTCRASTILDLLRERIQESLHQVDEKEMVTRDGMDISLSILETDTNHLQFAGAHNPLYIIRNGSLNEIPADRIDISNSAFEKMDFTNQEFECQTGDVLYLFTDGFADQFGGPRRKKYKYQKFKDFLLSIHTESMVRQKWLLDEEIEIWKGSNPQIDDILIMGIKIAEVTGK